MFMRLSTRLCSTSLPGGNQVDGLPPARHNTEAVGRPHGVRGSAPIGTLDHRKLKIEIYYTSESLERSDQVLDNTITLLLI